MESKMLNEQESLSIIQRMIETARQEQKDDGMGWITWGWILFAASTLTFINSFTQWFKPFFFWNVLGPITLLILAYGLIADKFGKKKERVKTYTGDLFKKLNAGFVIMLLILIMSMNLTNGPKPIVGFALIMALYGFWMLIYGAAFDFTPSVYGAYLTWSIAIGGLFVPAFKWTMLLHSLAILIGYIIPGYLANSEFKKSNRIKTA